MFIIVAISICLLNVNLASGDASTVHAHARQLSENVDDAWAQTDDGFNWKKGPSPACFSKDADLTTVEDNQHVCENFREMEQSSNKCEDLRTSLKCWVDPVYKCDAQKFRETCRSRMANFPECPPCLCDEICTELDSVKVQASAGWLALIQLYLLYIVAAFFAAEVLFMLVCYQCCPAPCCRSCYWCLCCVQPWCCMEEYCRICPCCRPCLTCCLPNCCGNPPKGTYAGVELAVRTVF